jgi:hypothetical protein
MNYNDAIFQFFIDVQEELTNKYPEMAYYLYTKDDIENFINSASENECIEIINTISATEDASWCPFCLLIKLRKATCNDCPYIKTNERCSPYDTDNTYGEILNSIKSHNLTSIINIQQHINTLKRNYND